MFNVRRLLVKDWDLFLVLVLTVGTVALSQVSVDTLPIRPLLTVLFVFFCPGYAFLHAIFRSSVEDVLMRMMLTIGLSIALIVLGGFLLNLTPWGLQTVTWVLLIGAVTVVATAAGLFRRVGDQQSAYTTFPMPDPVRMLIGTIAIALTIAAVALARNGALAQYSAYTQLWMQRQQDTYRISIQSQETASVHFNLEVKLGDLVVQEWTDIQMLPGDLWTNDLKLSRDARALASGMDASFLSATLYRLDAPNTVYRYVMLHLDSESKP